MSLDFTVELYTKKSVDINYSERSEWKLYYFATDRETKEQVGIINTIYYIIIYKYTNDYRIE